MGAFDFLNNLGESKDSFKKTNLENIIKEKIEFMEILINRNLMQEDFKNELIEKYLNKKLSIDEVSMYIQKSINLHNEIELKLKSIDEDEFKLKNDSLEYIGAIDKMPDDTAIIGPNRGKVSYNFVVSLFNHLKGRRLKLGEIIKLSDVLDFKLMKVFNFEQVTK